MASATPNLDEMERVVLWKSLLQISEPYWPKSKTGRPPFAIETMLRIHYLQHWFGLSDPTMEEAFHAVSLYLEFAGLNSGASRIPDQTTILRFRHLLAKHNLAVDMLRVVNDCKPAGSQNCYRIDGSCPGPKSNLSASDGTMCAMSTSWLRASQLRGTVEIAPQLSLEQTAKRIAMALSLAFSEERSGRYEEYPAYVAKGAGLEFTLLGPPLPENDIRDVKSSEFQLLISSELNQTSGQGHAVEVSAIYAHLIQEVTGLPCRGLELTSTT